MSKVYKIDKVACLKHIAAQHKTSLSYRSRTEEARRTAATKNQKQRYKNISTDKSANFGPPDRSTNFSCGEASALGKRARVPHISGSPTKKSKTIAMDKIIQFITNPHPDVLGKTVRMQFEVSGKNEWFEGIIATYDGLKGMFGIYFPSDGETHFASLDDEDLEILE